ncbi:MAG: nucleotidyl transferase AbiEii/AbiGii toxin family protein [Syntrophaceae bacterium]|nr:nucleotidyl transferase AbiEii/AbiGii toxin family protein [Syntrophaceae bacterium]
MYETYMAQAGLLLQILPLIKNYSRLSLKGGTALNFFIHDFPRLSVDIDLAYTQIDDRNETLSYITESMEDLSRQVERRFPGTRVQRKRLSNGYIKGLVIRSKDASIKIEPNLVIRGTVYSGELKPLASKVQTLFQAELDFPIISVPDLYGGKICAALDRQHPRDLFDIRLMFDTFGFTREIKTAFLVYLISHPRPIAEVLNPNLQDLKTIYEQEFKSMTREDVSLKDLEKTRIRLIRAIHGSLEQKDKDFLLSLKSENPHWDLLPIPFVKDLPAVKWKIINIEKMTKRARSNARFKLEKVLTEGPDLK